MKEIASVLSQLGGNMNKSPKVFFRNRGSCLVGEWLNFCARSVKWNFGFLLVLTLMGIFYSSVEDYVKQFLEKELLALI